MISKSYDGGRIIAGTEYCRSSDDRVRACRDGQGGIFAVLPAVDLDPRVESLCSAKPPQFTDFRQHLRQKFLSAKSGIDGHHQDDIAEVQHLLDKGDGTGRVKHRAGLLTKLPNLQQHPIELDRRRWFSLNQQVIGAGFREVAKITLWFD